MLLQRAGYTANRTARTYSSHKYVHLSVRVRPDFLSRSKLMYPGVGRILKLLQNYGAGNYERIRKGYRLTLGIAGSIGLGAGILFFVLNHEIFGLFVNEPEAIEAGGNYLKILALSQLFMVTESVTAGAFNGTGHTTPPALTGIIFTGARIPMAYFLTSFPQLGLTGIWWSITISSILKGSVLPLWFLHFQRKLK